MKKMPGKERALGWFLLVMALLLCHQWYKWVSGIWGVSGELACCFACGQWLLLLEFIFLPVLCKLWEESEWNIDVDILWWHFHVLLKEFHYASHKGNVTLSFCAWQSQGSTILWCKVCVVHVMILVWHCAPIRSQWFNLHQSKLLKIQKCATLNVSLLQSTFKTGHYMYLVATTSLVHQLMREIWGRSSTETIEEMDVIMAALTVQKLNMFFFGRSSKLDSGSAANNWAEAIICQ